MITEIHIREIKLWSYHGCLQEESLKGGEYIVNVNITADFLKAAVSDNLADTIDYTRVYQLIKGEMEIRSNLIENVVERIKNILLKTFPDIQKLNIEVIKLNPPAGGDIREFSVTVEV